MFSNLYRLRLFWVSMILFINRNRLLFSIFIENIGLQTYPSIRMEFIFAEEEEIPIILGPLIGIHFQYTQNPNYNLIFQRSIPIFGYWNRQLTIGYDIYYKG